MDLSSLLEVLCRQSGYASLSRAVADRAPLPASLHLPRSARPPTAASLALDLHRVVVFLAARPDRLQVLAEEVPVWAPELPLLILPGPVPLFYEATPWGPRTVADRARVLARLAARTSAPNDAGPLLVLAAAHGAMTRTLPAEVFAEHSRTVRRNDVIRPDALLDFLIGTGYAQETTVVAPGQAARRGGILDVWPPDVDTPVRLEFFGDQVDTLRSFQPATQVTEADIDHLEITPAREGLPALARAPWTASAPAPPPGAAFHEPTLEFLLPTMAAEPASFFDYLPPRSLVLFDDRAAFEEAVGELEEQAVALRKERIAEKTLRREFPLPYLPLEDLRDAASDFNPIDLGYLTDAADEGDVWGDRFAPGPRFAGQLRRLTEHLARASASHETSIVVSRQAPRLAEIWSEVGPPRPVVETLASDLVPGEIAFLHGALSEGWALRLDNDQPLHLLTDAEVFGWGRPQPRARPIRTAEAPETPFADLQPGDWVVHEDYGVGRFRDLVERTLDGLRREYLLIEYADGGQVYVPIHHADRVSRYVGVDGVPVSPARLGTQEWERAKGQARQAAEEVARDLLDLYARRMAAHGYAFSSDTAWQHELEASFPYVETEDQLEAIHAVREDMERPRPMDRLICGDVGYGKTEVALRAAFKAVQDSKQVAVLVPTTILAQQHYRTFRERLAPFPLDVEMLSRFRSRGEAAAILGRLAEGSIDIVIGTHRLLQRDVEFRDLGLLIIDEEQRFGVTHKEYLKRMRTEVDVLTMTATPIPRTLYLALTGARDISNINTPPDERLPVATHIGPYDPALVRQAILRELDRGGQVFFVHNRVQTIPGVARRIERLVPEASLAVAHGQMPEQELARVMERFASGEIDILLTTSIIESGLDFPNANTLIVDRSDWFGLAQLYQLRGRVGRGTARAYAYFFRQAGGRMGEDALRRLEILAEHTQLGSGYSIAMQDLELRGAGEILGTRQHGHIAAIGFHLYTRLLAAAVRRLRAAVPGDERALLPIAVLEDPLAVDVDLPLASAIPPDYVQDRELRLRLYRRMARLRTEEDIAGFEREIADRFGALPLEAQNLLFQLRVKILAARAELSAVTVENGQILLQHPDPEARFGSIDLDAEARRSRRGLWLTRLTHPAWRDRLIVFLRELGPAE
ncbi:MAG TPA: transcription-repair coupling factor [Anaerolineales bacterium]|nr:transcription-repair coupling factor [Anaerolineales bacterium]